MRKGFWLLLAMVLLFALGAKQAEKSYGAQRFDVAAEVLPGGDLQVHESVIFNFQGGPFTFVFRELPNHSTDGITNIVASVDGRVLPQGSGPGQVEVIYDDPIRVTWHMEPTSDAAREFGLDYRMLGVVRQESNTDWLWWRPLPVEYEYAIATSQTVITYPAEWSLAAQPSVQEGQATIAAEPGRVVVTGSTLGPNESLAISIPFQSGAVLSEPPAWQVTQEAAANAKAEQQARQNGLAWIWFALGGLVLVGSTALLYVIVAPYRRPAGNDKGKIYAPPGDLAPAMAGALRGNSAGVTWEQALATLFDLASRGHVVIEQLPKQRWRGHDFLIRRLDDGARPVENDRLRPHESSLMTLLLEDKSGFERESVKVSSLNNLISSRRWKRFEKSMKAELTAANLLCEERKKARERTMALSLVPMLLILVVVAILVIFSASFGLWPLVLAGALLLVTIMWLIGGSSISVLSEQGAQTAAEWESFYRYLKKVCNGKAAPANEDEFENYLPFATAYGLLHAWAKRFEKRGWTETPAYFRPLQSASQTPMVAFIAMTAATSSSGGSASTAGAGGAGAGGAAGGGASGAG